MRNAAYHDVRSMSFSANISRFIIKDFGSLLEVMK